MSRYDFMLSRDYLTHGIKRAKPIPALWDWWPRWLRGYWLFRNDVRLSRKEAFKATRDWLRAKRQP